MAGKLRESQIWDHLDQYIVNSEIDSNGLIDLKFRIPASKFRKDTSLEKIRIYHFSKNQETGFRRGFMATYNSSETCFRVLL